MLDICRRRFVAPLALLVLFSRVAFGQSTETDALRDLKRRADEFTTEGRHAEALALYDEVYRQRPDPAILFNQGRALDALNQATRALEKFEAFERDAPEELRARVPAFDKLLFRLRQRVAIVRIRTNVDGAEVWVRGERVATTPLSAPFRVDAGSVPIQIRKDGYLPIEKKLELTGGGENALDFFLVSQERRSILAVQASVPNAIISVDGVGRGQAPIEIEVAPGRHMVTAAREGYGRAERSLDVPLGERSAVSFALEKESGPWTRWWFWTAVGVGVGSAVAVTYALTREREMGSGDLEPGSIRTPFRF